MSREKTTLIVLVIIALVINAVSILQMGTPKTSELQQVWPWYVAISLVFLAMAFFFGAANAGIAALWASFRKRQPKLLAAFNVGVGVFVALQALAVVAYEDYKTTLRLENTAAVTPHEPSPAEERE